MFVIYLLSGCLMMQAEVSPTSPIAPTDAEPVVSKEEIAKLEEENWLTSKYLLIGTLVSAPPFVVGLSTGALAAVAGVLFIYSLVSLYRLDEGPKSNDYDRQGQQWRAAAVVSGAFFQSCATVSFFSCIGGGVAFLSALKAMDEIDDPD